MFLFFTLGVLLCCWRISSSAVDSQYSCPSYSAGNTSSAVRNFVNCTIPEVCPGDIITIYGDSGSCVGDQYIRLFAGPYGGFQLVENDDGDLYAYTDGYDDDVLAEMELCSSILNYTIPSNVSCGEVVLHQGCYEKKECSGVMIVNITSDHNNGDSDGSCDVASNSGEAVCEGHGYDAATCVALGCCEFDDGACWSSVGSDCCSVGGYGSSAVDSQYTWTYMDTTEQCTATPASPCGPAHWGSVAEGCNGDRQSPIDITYGLVEPLKAPAYPVNFRGCKDWKQFIGEEGYKVDLSKAQCPLHVRYNGVNYDMKSISVRSPSEHTIGGQQYAAEAQMVHHNSEYGDLVVSVMLDLSEGLSFMPQSNNSFFDGIERSYTRISPEGDIIHVGSHKNRLNPYNTLLPATPRVYTYDGSMTTPPCQEGVHWLVYGQPTVISQYDLNAIRKVGRVTVVNEWGNNNRPQQPRNGRKIMVPDH